MLVAVELDEPGLWPLSDRIAELRELARSAGAQVVDCTVQRRQRADPAYFIGSGKVEQIAARCRHRSIDLVIFDHDLTPAQARNLERRLQTMVVDRSQLILDIFAQRAQTREGKLQVELAQLRYLLPRLVGRGTELSRLGGGIGTRGPGETKLETDRRRIRLRIRELKRELAKVVQARRVQRRRRQAAHVPVIALVGYTNAGKSTLLRALTGSETLVEDRLFATLDPKTRRLTLPGNAPALLSDTVGFIHNLPPQLIAAFRATLEEVVEADVLLHVVDVSHPRAEETIEAVMKVLAELGAADKPIVTALNKIDRWSKGDLPHQLLTLPNAVPVSAVRGDGLERLKRVLAGLLAAHRQRLSLRIPYQHLDLLDLIYRRGSVFQAQYEADGVRVTADVDPPTLERIHARLQHTGS